MSPDVTVKPKHHVQARARLWQCTNVPSWDQRGKAHQARAEAWACVVSHVEHRGPDPGPRLHPTAVKHLCQCYRSLCVQHSHQQGLMAIESVSQATTGKRAPGTRKARGNRFADDARWSPTAHAASIRQVNKDSLYLRRPSQLRMRPKRANSRHTAVHATTRPPKRLVPYKRCMRETGCTSMPLSHKETPPSLRRDHRLAVLGVGR